MVAFTSPPEGLPDRTDPTNFNAYAIDTMNWLITIVGEIEDYINNASLTGYVPANILGTVSQSGGTPTGAIFETGSNANGYYTRFANGVLLCRHTLSVPYMAAERCQGTWTYPSSFAGTPNVLGSLDVGGSSATPANDNMGAFSVTPGASTAVVRQFRVTGGTDFIGGDTISAQLFASGRWF